MNKCCIHIIAQDLHVVVLVVPVVFDRRGDRPRIKATGPVTVDLRRFGCARAVARGGLRSKTIRYIKEVTIT